MICSGWYYLHDAGEQSKTVTMSIRLEINESPRDKIKKMTYAPSEDSDQPGHLPSLIRVFAVGLMGS